MKVAKITVWDGTVFHTKDVRTKPIVDFFARARTKFMAERRPSKVMPKVEIIEMTEEEYQAVPATAEALEFFGKS